MKKIYFLLLLLGGFANAQIVNIPDASFKARLLASNTSVGCARNSAGNYMVVDTNGDGNIQVAEAMQVYRLNIQSFGINDFEGIQAFGNLRELTCGFNNDPSLDVSALSNLTSLSCSNGHLTSLNVSSLANLTNIYCRNNQLTSLDVSTLTGMTTLNCAYNQLGASLDLTGCTALQTVYLSNNQYTSVNVANLTNLTILNVSNNNLSNLDVSTLSMLETLYCDSNALTSLNLNGLVNLEVLNCSNNPFPANTLNFSTMVNIRSLYCAETNLSALNISALVNLEDLDISGNQFTAFDFSPFVNIIGLDCSHNLLTAIDVSALSNLGTLVCSNNLLATINVENNHNLCFFHCNDNPQLVSVFMKNGEGGCTEYDFGNNPNLRYVCTDEDEITFLMDEFENHYLLPDVVVNSYCSFVPAGDFNTISGTTTFDANANGCDAGDLVQPLIRIGINDGAATGAAYTNASGSYVFYTQPGNHTITPTAENPSWFNFSPTNAVVALTTNNNSVTRNFCISPNGNHPDVEVLFYFNGGNPRPGFNEPYRLIYRNKGNQIASGTINLNYEQAKTQLVSATPNISSQTTNNLIWNYTNLLPFATREIQMILHTNSPIDSPPVNDSSQLDFVATINPIPGDETPADNVFNSRVFAHNSCDPNDKICLEGNVVSTSKIGDYLHYNIYFENTGTAPAANIVVKDQVDITKFDISSLQVLMASHTVMPRITGNNVEFIFENINLPVAGHGNVIFKIKTKNNLVLGNTVTNSASIYFDYNAPIITNLASTTFQALGVNEAHFDNSVNIYPNPAKDAINIDSDNTINLVQLFDIQGRLLATKPGSVNHVSLDIASCSNGVYFLRVITEKGMKSGKIIKE